MHLFAAPHTQRLRFICAATVAARARRVGTSAATAALLPLHHVLGTARPSNFAESHPPLVGAGVPSGLLASRYLLLLRASTAAGASPAICRLDDHIGILRSRRYLCEWRSIPVLVAVSVAVLNVDAQRSEPSEGPGWSALPYPLRPAPCAHTTHGSRVVWHPYGEYTVSMAMSAVE